MIRRGLCNISSTVDAMQRYTAPKNVSLFEELNILTGRECVARQSVLLDNYVKIVEIEANCMIDMIVQQIIPSVRRSDDVLGADVAKSLSHSLEVGVKAIEKNLEAIHAEKNEVRGLRNAIDLWV